MTGRIIARVKERERFFGRRRLAFGDRRQLGEDRLENDNASQFSWIEKAGARTLEQPE